ncbi:MAG TPA: amidohydrolase [Bacillota bacterium]|jgi:imidazolonepropionase-like amidohydrolase|nr:amidohydrolase [Bacillota bacterium]
MLIKNGRVFTMAGKVYENGCVLIENGKIKEVGEELTASFGEEIIDARGGWVLPGLVDAHSHLGTHEANMGFEGNDTNEITDPITPQLRVIDGLNPQDKAFEAVRASGVTTTLVAPGSANVIGGQCAVIKTYGRCVDEMVIVEPAAVKIAFGENPKRAYKELEKMPSTRMAIAGLLRQTLYEAKAYQVRKEKAAEREEYFAVDLKLEALLPVLEGRIPVKAHAHRADDILTAIRIAKEFNVSMTLDHCTEGHLITDYIKEAGFPAIVGPTMSARSKIELTNKSFFTAVKLAASGVKIAITTDHPVTQMQYLPLCAGLAVREGLPLEDALRAITINAAEIIGAADRVGSIEPGKDADLAIFDGNPLQTLTKTLYTIIDGRVVYKKE